MTSEIPGEADLLAIAKTQTNFTKRFIPPGSGSAFRKLIADTLAKIVAEDANTAFYVRRYTAGEFHIRQDYIDYLSNRFEFEMKQKGFL